jgi:hypothetical protein
MVRTVMMVLDLSRRCQNNSNTNISKIINRGTNAIGHLGHAHYNGEDQLTPKKVEALADELIVDVACGYKHTCVVTSKGSVLALENYIQLPGKCYVALFVKMVTSSNLKISDPSVSA